MLERARTNPKIHFETEVEVAEVLGDGTVSGLRLRDVHRGTTRDLAVTAVFVAIGHDPRNELVKGVVDLTPTGYVEVSHPGTHTSVDGVFAVGDLVDDHYRQAVTAAGTGCRAAIDVERWLG
ncbi:thioredoxin reductase [Rhodococcus opacus]|jgi:thioredoxin reductase (NADPH)|nr:thioredoxin reductase [Rhodococcus opacus]